MDLDVCWRFQSGVQLLFGWFVSSDDACYHGSWVLIHSYATGYMADDPSFSRFFSYMNLFVAAMLMLVLGDNLVVLYLGWEGVGLCSYLLIGFWYTKPENGYAARKAFVVTRVGDTSMAIGLFLLFAQLGTLNIQDLLHAAELEWTGQRIGGCGFVASSWWSSRKNRRSCLCRHGCQTQWQAQHR